MPVFEAETVQGSGHIDWIKKGKVVTVKDQGRCGSCWSFSTALGTEAIHAIEKGNLVSLSEEALVDCSTTSYGC